MKKLFLSLILILPFVLTGCWDKIEIENRGLVISLGFDKATATDQTPGTDQIEDKFSISMVLPNIGDVADKDEAEDELKRKTLKKETSDTVLGAMAKIDADTSKQMYFGQIKLVVLGKELLENEALFKKSIDALERSKEMNRKIIVLSTEGKAEEILKSDVMDEPLVGIYITNFYKDNESRIATTYKQDLENLISTLRSTNGTLIPKINYDDKKKELTLGGTAIVKDYKLWGWLNENQTRGYLWTKEKAHGAILTTEYENIKVPFKVNSNTCKIKFYEENNKIICSVKIDVEGTINEFTFKNDSLSDESVLEKLSKDYERQISTEIFDTFGILKDEAKYDGMGLSELLRKHKYGLYKKYENQIIENMDMVITTDVKITGTGSIK